jgi:diguanylate cyclase (GGDEF)-like protein
MPRDEKIPRSFSRFATGIFLASVALIGGSSLVGHSLPSLAVVALFGLLAATSENVGLRFPLPVGLSPILILVMAAVVAIGPNGRVLGASVVGACGGLLIDAIRGRRWSVVACNVGQMALAAGGAAAVFGALSKDGVSLYAVFPATVLCHMAINAGLVIPAVSAKAGQPIRSVWREVRSSLASDLVFGLAGLGLGEFYHHEGPIAVVAIVGTGVVAQTVFLSVVRLRQAYTRIEVLYRFTQRLERSQDERDAVMSILTELRELMGAGTAELTTLDGAGWHRTSVRGERGRAQVSVGTDPSADAGAVGSGPVRVDALAEGAARRSIVERAGDQALLVPLRLEGRLLGAITIGEPTDGRSFGPEDLRLLEALANHAAVSLDNSRLLGRLRYDSSHDQLTGLPNRARFNELISDLPDPSAVLLVDLDRFKEINDTLGHAHGDLLLLAVAARLADEVGHRGIVARLGGDEFGVLLPQAGSGDAAQVAVALLAALEQPFDIDELKLEITASIGVAVNQGDESAAGRLLQQADVAMYSAKEAHSGWEAYSTERDHYSPRRLALAGELRHAIDRDELEVHYQPKSDLRTGAVCGVEALVRWRHPRYGMIGPDQFIPVAESAGLIRPLTLLVLTRAVQHQRELRSLGYDLEVAVNLSVRSVLDVNLPDQVAQVLTAHGMAAASLTLEITEGSVMADPSRTIGILGRLSALGCSISVDDFGTGYSSLAYLKRLPADEVKIDRSFVAGMLANDSDRAIVQSTVDLARNLGLRAVAEGVEDEATWKALAALGCDFAQGFYVSPALPAADLQAWLLRTQAAVDPTA